MSRTTPRIATAAAAALIAASPASEASALEKLALPPGSTIEDSTVGEWTGAWWRWLLATPLHRDPALDETGDHCGIDQEGPVWFLAGSFNERPVARRCKVPAGKHVLLPMYTGIVRPTPEQTEATCDASRDKAKRFTDTVLGLYASLNGEPLAQPERFRERTANCFDPSGSGRAVSAQDGYWLMLQPLPPGRHVLRYGRNEKGGKQNTDVSVVLEVGAQASPREVALGPDEATPYPVKREPSRAPRPAGTPRPADEDFPQFSSAVIRVRPGFGLGDFAQRLVALILREGKYRVVVQNRLRMGALHDIRFTWPDLKERYAAIEDLKPAMPHPMTVSITPNENGTYRIDAGGVNPNAGASFALRAEIASDAARLVREALDRRVRVSDEERLRVLRYRPVEFNELAGGDPVAELNARASERREQARDRAAASRPPSEEDQRQFTAGDLKVDDAELHAVSVHKGPERPGSPSRVTVTVIPFTARPVALLLSAYEPVEWHVVSINAKIIKVIALGHRRQTIASAPEGSERVSRSVEDGFEGAFLGHGRDGEQVKRYFERAKALTGRQPESFQSRDSSGEFIVDGDAPVRIEGKRVSVALPPSRAPVLREPGTVRFEAPSHEAAISADGTAFSSCHPGQSGAIRTNRSHVRGKHYFELTLRPRGVRLHPGTNVGLAPAAGPMAFLTDMSGDPPRGGVGVLKWGEVSGYRDGDVFGIAADLDAGRLYYHVNGEWKGAAPGDGAQGIPLAPGKAYAAAASVAGSPLRGSSECAGWAGNFGKLPFKYAMPQGYKSYDGER